MFNHPTKVCMTYFSHMKFSLYLSYTFADASIKAFIHAIYPDIYITHSTDTIQKIKSDIDKIGCRNKKKYYYLTINLFNIIIYKSLKTLSNTFSFSIILHINKL